jgi:O-antigen/teichoic acid export membrane protein
MLQNLKVKIYNFLRWSEKWALTDMVYLAKGGFWLTLGQIISSISGLLLAIAFANLLPKEVYGNYKYILSLVGLLSIPTLSGMRTALMQAVARGYEGSIIPAMKTKIRWGLIGGVASVILAGYYFYNGNTTLTISFLIAGIFIPFMDSLAVYGPIFPGRKLFKQGTKINIITQIISAAIMVAVLFLTKNIFLILLSYFSSRTLLRAIFLIITFKKFKPNKKEDPETISYGKHLSLIDILGTIAEQLDKILVFHYLGAAELAIYSFAVIIPEQIKALFKNMRSLILPKFAQKNKEEAKKIIFNKTPRLLIIILFITLAYILTAPIIYKLLLPNYTESIFYSQIFAVSLLVISFSLPSSSALQALGAKKQLYQYNVFSSIFQIITIFFMVNLYGLIGMVLARVISRFMTVIILFILIRKL